MGIFVPKVPPLLDKIRAHLVSICSNRHAQLFEYFQVVDRLSGGIGGSYCHLRDNFSVPIDTWPNAGHAWLASSVGTDGKRLLPVQDTLLK